MEGPLYSTSDGEPFRAILTLPKSKRGGRGNLKWNERLGRQSNLFSWGLGSWIVKGEKDTSGGTAEEGLGFWKASWEGLNGGRRRSAKVSEEAW